MVKSTEALQCCPKPDIWGPLPILRIIWKNLKHIGRIPLACLIHSNSIRTCQKCNRSHTASRVYFWGIRAPGKEGSEKLSEHWTHTPVKQPSQTVPKARKYLRLLKRARSYKENSNFQWQLKTFHEKDMFRLPFSSGNNREHKDSWRLVMTLTAGDHISTSHILTG